LTVPSRYGPGVLPEPDLSFGNALSGLARGFDYAQDLRDRRRERQREDIAQRQHEEDRNRYMRQLAARDLAEPGAMAESSFLDQPGAKSFLVPGGDVRKQLAPRGSHPADGGGLDFTAEGGRRYFQTATGPVVDRKVARDTMMADQLARMIPSYARAGFGSPQAQTQEELKRHPERGAAVTRAEDVHQKGKELATGQAQSAAAFRSMYPDLPTTMSDEEVVRIGRQRQGRDYNVAHPMPEQPGAVAARGQGAADRTTEQLQRELASAQSDVHDMESRVPPGVGRPGHVQWLQRYQAARARRDRAQADVDASLRHPGAPRRGAPRAATRPALPALPPLPD
jgi:hypothetical protein